MNDLKTINYFRKYIRICGKQEKDVDGDDAISFAGNNGHMDVVKYLQGLK